MCFSPHRPEREDPFYDEFTDRLQERNKENVMREAAAKLHKVHEGSKQTPEPYLEFIDKLTNNHRYLKKEPALPPANIKSLSSHGGTTLRPAFYKDLPSSGYLPSPALPSTTSEGIITSAPCNMAGRPYTHLAPDNSMFRVAPPKNLEIRLKSQSQALDALDKAFYDRGLHPVVDVGGLPIGEEDGDKSTLEREVGVRDILERHVEGRMGHVMWASKRLQAVMGISNDIPFDLPYHDDPLGLRKNRAPANQSIKPETLAIPDPKLRHRRTDSSGIIVDPITGRGLRRWLAVRGYEIDPSHVRHINATSITFHDITPAMNATGTGENAFSNIMLAHYDADMGLNPQRKVGVWEIDLPADSIDPKTGNPFGEVQTWVYFFIERPIVSFDDSNMSTIPRPEWHRNDEPSPDGDTKLPRAPLRPPPGLNYPEYAGEPHRRGPPNFPSPMPKSWVVFAAPKANITSYKPQVDSTMPADSSDIIHKRIHYDLSHQGLPIFEFSSSRADTNTVNNPYVRESRQWLSVEHIGPYFTADRYETMCKDEYNTTWLRFQAELPSNIQRFGESDTRACRNRASMVPTPFQGEWWNEFYNRLYADEASWARIRKVMSTGYCHVVVRYDHDPRKEEWNRDHNCMGMEPSNRPYVSLKDRIVKGRIERGETRRRKELNSLKDYIAGGKVGITISQN